MCAVRDFSEIGRLRAAGDRRLPCAEEHKTPLSASQQERERQCALAGQKKSPTNIAVKAILPDSVHPVPSHLTDVAVADFWSCAKIKSCYSVVSTVRYFSMPTIVLHLGHLSLVSMRSVMASSVTMVTRALRLRILVLRACARTPDTGSGSWLFSYRASNSKR